MQELLDLIQAAVSSVRTSKSRGRNTGAIRDGFMLS